MADATQPEAEAPATAAPALRIINSDATAEEVAAVVAVLASLGGTDAPTRRARPEWGSPHRAVRRPVAHGPGGWRASALP